MTRTYPHLNPIEFGHQLLKTGDLDPIYIALAGVPWGMPRLSRWLVAYWCLYHAGASCWLADQDDQSFWTGLLDATRNEKPTPVGGRWPRGHERRHLRGHSGIEAVKKLRFRYPTAEHMVTALAHPINGSPRTYAEIAAKVQSHYLFGPWIAFKVCDMLERVLEVPINFDEADVFMFDSPKEGAQRVFKWAHVNPPKDQGEATAYALKLFKETFAYLAPPRQDRGLNIQEFETILCKWKSHLNGHYPLNNDLIEIHEGLIPWLPTSRSARDFQAALPPIPA